MVSALLPQPASSLHCVYNVLHCVHNVLHCILSVLYTTLGNVKEVQLFFEKNIPLTTSTESYSDSPEILTSDSLCFLHELFSSSGFKDIRFLLVFLLLTVWTFFHQIFVNIL